MQRYQTTVSLTKKDDARVVAMKKKGIKIVDIFRAGLETMSARVAVKEQADYKPTPTGG